MDTTTKTVMLCGVGGQGTILAGDILARVAMEMGQDVKLSEIHGMAQRGGAVTTIIRIGSSVATMVADPGSVDYLVAFETTEGLRSVGYLAPGARFFVNDTAISPMSVLSGKAEMPVRAIERLQQRGAKVIPAEKLAIQAGSLKAVNIVLLGALSSVLPYELEVWNTVIAQRVPAKFKDVNLEAFRLGRQCALEA